MKDLNTEMIVAARNIDHRYKKAIGLNDFNLNLSRGRFHAIVGPDGVGKSTFLGLVATAKHMQKGELLVLGQDVRGRKQRADLAHRIAYMPQGLGRNLYPDLTISEHLDYFAVLFGVSYSERVTRGAMLLQRTGLAGFEHRRARHLSGGMKQKLALCCSLIHSPELLILDEPTTGVDPLSRREFFDLLHEARAQNPNLTVVCSTGYVEEASHFDEVVFIHAGRVLLQETVSNVRSHANDGTLSGAYTAILEANGLTAGQEDRTAANNHPPGDEIVIEAQKLTKRFGKFTAVDSIDLSVRRGEIFGFLGPNGCGKSTTMRMLVGLSQQSAGKVNIFGKVPKAGSRSLRAQIGYMSQSFSLYGELSVKRNISLNLRLQHIDAELHQARSKELRDRFGLGDFGDKKASDLPLGLRQRLALACAVAHKPPLLILDEPTSGVDPSARNGFWNELNRLADEDGITIFVSTHYLSEAERCDRVAFMDQGTILTTGTPTEIKSAFATDTLEEAFIACLKEKRGEDEIKIAPQSVTLSQSMLRKTRWPGLQRLLATALRESRELVRDPVRLGVSLLASAFLLIVLGHGISMDVSNLTFAVRDHDRSPASRALVEELEGSRYFTRQPDPADERASDRMLISGEASLLVEIPPSYGRSLKSGHPQEIGFWLDGGMPSRAETASSYAQMLFQGYLLNLQSSGMENGQSHETVLRYRYNPNVESAMAFAPGCIGILLMLTPAMLMAVAVAREKEMGPILNLYATPLTVSEFLIGKQLPYIAIGVVNFLVLFALVRIEFGVPFTGSFPALLLAALLQSVVATGFGMILAALTRSQVAALTAAQILTMVPSIGYSGLVVPIGSMEGAAWYVAHGFPSSYFHGAVIGSFLKGFGFQDMAWRLWALFGFGLAFTSIALLMTREQER